MVKHLKVDDVSPQVRDFLKQFDNLLRQSWERNRTVPEEEVTQVVAEVIQEVRREKGQGQS